jgi:hypothetical protein
MSEKESAATLGKKEFADLIGQSPSHVTKLAQDGRLVLDGSGRGARVRVAESLARIEQTGGGRPDVADRHARQRAASAQTQRGSAQGLGGAEKIERGATVQAGGANDGTIDKIGSNYQAARAVKEKYAALTAKAEYETLIGNLIPRDDVDAALRFVGATVRSLMDVFPDQQAPILCAVSDIHEVQSLLTEACRNVLLDIGQAIERQKQTLTKEA